MNLTIPAFDPYIAADAYNADWGGERPNEAPGYTGLMKDKGASSDSGSDK